MAARPSDYGPVLILEGPHTGQVGYYDDDNAEGATTAAVVYLGEPFESEYVLVPHDGLERIIATSLDVERWKRRHPWLVKYLGLP
jgi:hypothetical protein